MSNREYTVQGLIHNQSFRRLAKGTASDSEIHRWNVWIEKSEDNRRKAREAMSEIAGFTFGDPEDVDVEEQWQQFKQAKDTASEALLEFKQPDFGSSIKWLYRVAAILVLGFVIGLGLYVYSPGSVDSTHLEEITQEKTVRTGAGERKTVQFSNGSKIFLNSNSAVTYSIGGGTHQTINVIVEGEVFFDAEGGSEQEQPIFAVSTPDGIIRDIGTEFLVTIKRDRSRVILQEGKVEIKTKDKGRSAQNISVSHGEMLEFNKSEVLTKKNVNSTFYTSWATGSMTFDNTSIKEFASFIEQRFDVSVQITSSKYEEVRIEGGIYFRSFEELVRSVSGVVDIPVYQSEDRKTVYIGETTNK